MLVYKETKTLQKMHKYRKEFNYIALLCIYYYTCHKTKTKKFNLRFSEYINYLTMNIIKFFGTWYKPRIVFKSSPSNSI